MPNSRPLAEWIRLMSIAFVVIGLAVIAGSLPLYKWYRGDFQQVLPDDNYNRVLVAHGPDRFSLLA